MTAETVYKRALKATAECVRETEVATDADTAQAWATTALTLVKVAESAQVMGRVSS